MRPSNLFGSRPGLAEQPGRVVTPSPRTELLVAATVVQSSENYGYRPQGTSDWLLVAVEEGAGRLGPPLKEEHVGQRDLFLYPPGAPHDYAARHPGSWKNTWVHFIPSPDWVPLLDWPAGRSGARILAVPPEEWPAVLGQLHAVVLEAQRPAPNRLHWARNALERALLMIQAACPPHDLPDPRIRRAMQFLSENAHRPVGMADLERAVGLARTQLTLLFRRETGTAPMQFLKAERMRRAVELIQVSNLPVAEVSEMVGFQSPFYFSTQFRARYGCSPSQYRRLRQGGSEEWVLPPQ